jgi:hypothetical protein
LEAQGHADAAGGQYALHCSNEFFLPGERHGVRAGMTAFCAPKSGEPFDCILDHSFAVGPGRELQLRENFEGESLCEGLLGRRSYRRAGLTVASET